MGTRLAGLRRPGQVADQCRYHATGCFADIRDQRTVALDRLMSTATAGSPAASRDNGTLLMRPESVLRAADSA